MEPLPLAFVIGFIFYWTGKTLSERIIRGAQGFFAGLAAYVAVIWIVKEFAAIAA